jgi:hypothetical protein
MPPKWTPPFRTSIPVPPGTEDIKTARDLCTQMLGKMFHLFRYAGYVAEKFENKTLGAPEANLGLWRSTTETIFREIEHLSEQGDACVLPWVAFWERFSTSELIVGSYSYSSAFLAILGMVKEFIGRTSAARAKASEIDKTTGRKMGAATALAKTARKIWSAGIEVAGEDYLGMRARLEAELRVQAARAAEASGASEASKLSGEEKMIVDALRKKGKRMNQADLLHDAHLTNSGSNRFLLSQMRQRGVIGHERDNWGRGYGLPEWTGQKV